MAALLFRCTNSHCTDEAGKPQEFEFTPTLQALDPQCPKCKTVANDPKYGGVIVRLVKTHFDPPSHIGGMGKGFRACDETKPIQVGGDIVTGLEAPNPFHNGTGVLGAVNCPQCKASEAYQAALLATYGDEPPRSELKASLERLEPLREKPPLPTDPVLVQS